MRDGAELVTALRPAAIDLLEAGELPILIGISAPDPGASRNCAAPGALTQNSPNDIVLTVKT